MSKKSEDLPVSSVNFSVEALRKIDSSRVKKLIGPLLAKAHRENIRTLSVFSWENEDLGFEVGEVLTLAVSQQFNSRCTLIFAEGLRFRKDAYDSHRLLVIPDVDDSEFFEQLDDVIEEDKVSSPFRVVVGPDLAHSIRSTSFQFKLAKTADARVLVIEEDCLTRMTLHSIKKLTKKFGIHFWGIILIKEKADQAKED